MNKNKQKFKFTTQGVADWNIFFYSQDSAYQREQIVLVRTDVRAWTVDTFELEASQVEWLYALPERFLVLVSNQLATTLTLQLPVRLEKPEMPAGGTAVYGVKRGEAHNPISGRASADSEAEIEGEFVFTITY